MTAGYSGTPLAKKIGSSKDTAFTCTTGHADGRSPIITVAFYRSADDLCAEARALVHKSLCEMRRQLWLP